MTIKTQAFQNEKAPCGQLMDGERMRERDDDCLITDERFFKCGCKTIRHEYHDGAVSRQIVHHDGTILQDELDAE